VVVRERSCLSVTRHRYALIAGGGPPELGGAVPAGGLDASPDDRDEPGRDRGDAISEIAGERHQQQDQRGHHLHVQQTERTQEQGEKEGEHRRLVDRNAIGL